MKQNKFLIINGESIKRPTYIVKREFAFNDFENDYFKTGEETLDSVFELHGIPSKYRKVIVDLSNLKFLNKIGEDYITKIKYNITINKNENVIKGITNNYCFYENSYFESSINFARYKEVLFFYNNLKKDGFLKQYIEVLSNFYRINNVTENIQKYYTIIINYRNGVYGKNNLTLYEVLTLANENDLINNMSLYELYYLLDKSNGIFREIFVEAIKNKLNDERKNGVSLEKVLSRRKNEHSKR